MLICVVGLVKNQRLERNILTPTTKAADHDVPITPHEVMHHYFIFNSTASTFFLFPLSTFLTFFYNCTNFSCPNLQVPRVVL